MPRPQAPRAHNTEEFKLRLPAHMREQLEAHAAAEQLPISVIVRRSIHDWLSRNAPTPRKG